MANISILLTIGVGVLTFQIPTLASSKTDSGIIINMEEENEDPDRVENDKTKHRIPSKSILCIVNSDGLIIQNHTSSEITKYEICDEFGNIIASFMNEKDFIAYIFSASGSFLINFYINGNILHGCLIL